MTAIELSAGQKHTIRVGDKVQEVTLRPGEVRHLPFTRTVMDIPKVQSFTAPIKKKPPTIPPAYTPPVTALKTIGIRSEGIGHKGTIYNAETSLGANVSQFKYDVWQTIGRLTEQIEVKGKEVTRYGVISFTIPHSAQTTMERRIAIKWVEQEIAGQRYKAGWTEGVVIERAAAAPPVTAPPLYVSHLGGGFGKWSRARTKVSLEDIIDLIKGYRGKKDIGFKPTLDNLVDTLRKFRK